MAIVVTAVVVLVCAAAVAAASGWHIVKSRSTRGQFAVTSVSATIHHPHKIGVRLKGGSGLVVWACSKGFRVSSWSHNYGRGTHTLSHVRGSSCDVTASIGGSGRITVQILTR